MTEQIRFNEAMVRLAREIMQIVQSSPQADSDWSEAYVDARFAPEEGCSLDKFRLKLKNGTLVSFETSTTIDLLLKELWDLRPFCLSNSWYGLTIVVTPSGNCRTKFNFDPDCIGDPHFFDE